MPGAAAAVSIDPMEETSRATVLVVDDEPTIVEVVANYLGRAGFETHTAADGPSAISSAIQIQPDLIVLDLMLPEIGGMEVMRILREDEKLTSAIILLTSKSEESDRLVGLRRGADGYMVKPFSPAELVARVEAVLRRASPPDGKTEPIRLGDLTIDQSQRRVTMGEDEIALTQLEFDLLAFLASHPGQVFSRDHLMEEVWGQSVHTDTSTVTVHIRRLREKLESDPSEPSHVETVWGVGYRFRP